MLKLSPQALSWPGWLYQVTPHSCISAAQDAGTACLESVGLSRGTVLPRFYLCWAWGVLGFLLGLSLACCWCGCGLCSALSIYFFEPNGKCLWCCCCSRRGHRRHKSWAGLGADPEEEPPLGVQRAPGHARGGHPLGVRQRALGHRLDGAPLRRDSGEDRPLGEPVRGQHDHHSQPARASAAAPRWDS